MAFKIIAEDLETFSYVKEVLNKLHENVKRQISVACKNGMLIECDFLNEKKGTATVGFYVPKNVDYVEVSENKVIIKTDEILFSFIIQFEQNFHLQFI
jgi:hypothetical protein